MFSNHLKLVVLGIVVHFILLYSIFDIYYASPLVSGTRLHPITNGKGLAKRLVIISADGLRSDTFLQHPDKSPFLHSIIRNNMGCWGISTSHVPTESRPGHVALLAGFYEDVSAVARGWKLNPVPFDSIINRSHAAWAWGSPDIVPMFTKEIQHASSFVYSSDLEKFFSIDAAELDRWVFRKVEEFIIGGEDQRIFVEKAVFFLHLLGLDTHGHGFKPHSKEYINSIKVVDEGIKKTVQLFGSVFGDNKTAYVFVSDHGMTDWGSHGAGTDAEILTPFVAWGSGVKHVPRKIAFNQVDTVPFMAALLGVAVPMNSIGILPHECLQASPKYVFQSTYANFKQVLEQFTLKRLEKKKRSFSFFFREFGLLGPEKIAEVQKEIHRFADLGRYEAAAFTCLQWIRHARAGILYFHRYERSMLSVATTFSFIFWTLLLYLCGSRWNSLPQNKSLFMPNRLSLYPFLGTFCILFALQLPFSLNLYILLPIYLASIALNFYEFPQQRSTYKERITSFIDQILLTPATEIAFKFLKVIAVTLLSGLILAVLTAVFISRAVLSLLLVFLAFLPFSRQEVPGSLKFWQRLWLSLCLVLAIFPQLPPVGRTPSPFLCIFSPIISSLCLLIFSFKSNFILIAKNLRLLACIHAFSAFVITITELFGDLNRPYFLLLRMFCWISLPAAFILPITVPNLLMGRLICWFSSLYIPYALLSLSYESFFFLFFFALLIVYVRMDFLHMSDSQFWEAPILKNSRLQGKPDNDTSISFYVWIQAFIVVVFIEISFFGTGNVASLNSFNPSFLRCFLNVFSPFTMTALLIFKIALPFLAIAFAITVTLGADKTSATRLSLVLLIITDAMAAVFFFQLVDDGSWLEIGTSISHYVISMLTSVIVFLLLQSTQWLLFVSFPSSSKKKTLAL